MLPSSGERSHEHRLYDQMLEHDPAPFQASPGRPFLKLQIELQNGSKVYINPQPCDEPVRLATEFCEEHNLDSEMIDILAESIKRSITHSHQSYKKDPCPQEVFCNREKDVQAAMSCKTSAMRSPQYFSKKFSVNSSLGLYEKGVMLEDAKKHWIARQNERKVVEEMRECTHKPKINKLSRSLITERDAERERSKNEESSLERLERKRLSKNLSSIRSSILIESKHSHPPPLQECRNDPNISKSNSSVFEKLYKRRLDEISRSKILSEMLKEQTHHPVINDISKEIVGSASFSQRLARYEREKIDKHSKLRRMEQEEKENMHRPKTGPAPQNRNAEGLPIGDFLYAKKKKAPVLKKETQQPHINQTSKVIYDKRKAAAFHRIFDHLSSGGGNGSGKRVDWKLLDSARIDQELLLIIHPLVEQIQILQIELNLEDFKAALNYLFGTLSPTDKGTLLNFRPPSQQPLPPPKRQTVEMNRNSEAIARSMGRSRFSIYDYCEIRESMRVQRMEQERIEKQRREMQECTFEPKIGRNIYY